MSNEIRFNEIQQERKIDKTLSDVFKASLVGMLAVVITVIPFEQFIAQIVGVSYTEFRGGMPAVKCLFGRSRLERRAFRLCQYNQE